MPDSPATAREPRLERRWRSVSAFVLILLALGLAWEWYQSRTDLGALREEVAKRLRDVDSDSRDARLLARQAQDTVRDLQSRLGQVETRLAESQSQQLALEALYQELSRGRDEWALAEIEQILTIASQQLQLAGNVNAALVALQTADARLARADRPQFLAIRKAIARDIDRLKAAPNVDLVGLALKLDQVIASVDSLPFPSDKPAQAPPEPLPSDGFWARLGSGLWGELKQLVQVRNIEQPEPPLLAPSQAYFLKENLRLQLLNARLALIERNQTLFRNDVQSAIGWLNRYFDSGSRQVQTAGGNLKQLSSSGISLETPDISESLTAVRSFKTAREKPAR